MKSTGGDENLDRQKIKAGEYLGEYLHEISLNGNKCQISIPIYLYTHIYLFFLHR